MFKTSLLASVALAAVGSSPAYAQTDPAPQASADARPQSQADQPPEIVITAQRRTENLQNVSVSATALSGEDLNNRAVARIEDVQNASPALSITDQGLTQSVNIRGIGIASGSPQVTNGVATYIDSIFQPPIVTTTLFYDISSVEVLRGPQGTLVGSNSTGGAIFINSQVPELGRVGGYLQAGYGNFNAFQAQGALNIPISRTLAIRAAGLFSRRDSYYNDLGPLNNHPGRLNEMAGRVMIRWEPGGFRLIGKAELIDRNTGGYAYRPVPGTPFAAGRTTDIRDLAYNSPTRGFERGLLTSLEMRYELDSGIILRSVSGYMNKRINNLYDSDATLLIAQTQDQFVRERQWSEEINIISPTTGAFNWIVGGYYQRNKIDVAIQLRAASPVDPTDISIINDKQISGVFAQAGYRLTPELNFELGVRYSHFKSEGTGGVRIGNGLPFFPPGGLLVADPGGQHSDGRVTGRFAINWQPSPDHLLYAFVAHGYKAGGFNSPTSEFGPESVWDYEAGWKARFLDNHLRTQVGLFHMEYKSFQFDSIDTTTGQNGTANVANASISGVELQAEGRFGGFGFNAGLSYVHSRLAAVNLVNARLLPPGGQLGPQCPAGVPSNPPICFDYSPFIGQAGGGPNLFSPKWTVNVGVNYEIALGPQASLTPRLNYAFLDSRFSNLFYSPITDRIPSRGLLSALLTLRVRDWTLEAYGTNLTNEGYVSGQFGNNEFYGAPREYGIRASVRF